MRDITNRLALRIIQDWKIQLKAEVCALIEQRTLELFHRLKQSKTPCDGPVRKEAAA